MSVMFMGDLVGVATRRWTVLAVGVGLILFACYYVRGHVASEYQASGQVILLLPSGASGPTESSNPYLNEQYNLSATAGLVATHVMAEDVKQDLARQGFDAHFNVAVAPGTGPVLGITATDASPEIALATRDAVVAEVSTSLVEMQTDLGIDQSQIIGARSSTMSATAEVLPGSRVRALAGTLAAGVLALLLTTFGLDRLLTRRRRVEEPVVAPRALRAAAP